MQLLQGSKTVKSIIKKKKRKHEKIALLAKEKLNIMAVLISKSLIDSYVKQCNKQRITRINERRNNKFLKLLRNTPYKYKQKNVRSKCYRNNSRQR